MAGPRLGELVGAFFRTGSFTLGGGSAIQAALYLELVEKRAWLTAEEFGLVFGLARFTPGTNVLACSAALAWRLGGWAAAVLAVVAVSLPASVLVLGMLDGYERIRTTPWVMSAIQGALAAVAALIVVSSWKIVAPYAKQRRWVRIVILTGSATLALAFGWLSPIWILLLSVLGGILLDRAGVA